ncbi:MAG: hypothetical protein CBC29_06340 [Methylococcaceae bacterium TMED69]|nr:MAG: hypothetical protein CBC29_06340 [Methylococcaceae bacterium TMED69]|tara:strand:+ start:782 stop:1024 length:243 start_codon:yes stop_codon:yes gene_type:complete
MNQLLMFFIIFLSFFLGAGFGSFIKKQAFESQDWKILKWHQNLMAYRLIPSGARVFKKDRVLIALKVDTSHIEKEGRVLE